MREATKGHKKKKHCNKDNSQGEAHQRVALIGSKKSLCHSHCQRDQRKRRASKQTKTTTQKCAKWIDRQFGKLQFNFGQGSGNRE